MTLERDTDVYIHHGCIFTRMLLTGPKGATQFVWRTRIECNDNMYEKSAKITPWDFGYHAYESQYEGQLSMGECGVLNGKECFYDGSSLIADKIFDGMLSGSIETVWDKLESAYIDRFGEEDDAA